MAFKEFSPLLRQCPTSYCYMYKTKQLPVCELNREHSKHIHNYSSRTDYYSEHLESKLSIINLSCKIILHFDYNNVLQGA